MESDYSVQFCADGRIITGDFYAEDDATEIRLWSADSTCIVAVEKNARSGKWHVSASDVFSWTPKARLAFGDWRDAMRLAGSEVPEYIKSAGY